MTIHRLRPLVLALAFTLPLAGCWDKTPESRIETAKQALQKSDSRTAIIELKNALEKAPSNAEARLMLAQVYLSTGLWDNSEKELRKASEFGVEAERTLPMLAKALVRMGKYKEATQLTIPSVGLSSLATASIKAEKANAYLALNQPVQATSMIDEGERTLTAVGANAFSVDLQLAKARLAFTKGQIDQAMAMLETALQHDPKSISTLSMKAELQLLEGKSQEALKNYELITASKPDEIVPHLAIADFKLNNNDLAGAETEIRAAEKINPKMPLAQYMHAKLSLLKGDLNKANELLLKVLAVAPDHLPSLMLDAALNLKQGNHEQSLKAANRVLGRVPNHLPALKIVAANDLQMGNAQDALDLLRPIAQAHPNDGELLSLLGEASLQLKQYDQSKAYLDRAAVLLPNNAVIKQNQARGDLAQGRIDPALRELEQAAGLSAKASNADMTLIALNMNRKEFDAALRAIANLEKKSPNNPLASNMRGLALMGKNDESGAKKAFEQALTLRPGFYPAAANLASLDIAAKKPDQARQRFEGVLKADAKNTQAMLALADLAALKKNPKETQDWLEKAVKADPKAFSAHAAMVRFFLSNKENQKALTYARQVANANPNSPQALNLLGAAQVAAGDKTGGLASYTKASQLAPNSADALYRLGAAQAVSAHAGEGRANLEKTLKLEPGHVGALDALLLMDLADKKPDRALLRARAFQAKNPRSAVGYFREGDVLFAQKQFAQAAKAYEQGLNRGNDLQAFSQMASALFRAGDQKLADQKIGELVSRHPGDVRIQTFAAELNLNYGRNAESLRLYESLQKAQPNNPAILNNMAVLYQRLQDSRALPTAEQALKLTPADPGALDTLGWILLDQGQASRAVELLRQATAKAPQAPTIHYHLAAALAKVGNKAEARRELEPLLKAGDFPELAAARQLLSTL